ncbi:hypothetical protein WJX72_011586 [[Myrmecia] bisecta]|uniref:Desiccation-related protein PCC13-62 n=1 Tax=[Myrmecia] bisecta TaxID=41462 RepID=A0AAW1PDS2_9CHLO
MWSVDAQVWRCVVLHCTAGTACLALKAVCAMKLVVPTTPAPTPAATAAPTNPPATPAPTQAATPSPPAPTNPPATPAPTPRPINDLDVLAFALQLEYLEANFYSCAATGKPIDQTLWLGGPAPTGCYKGNYSAPVLDFFTELAANEVAHVKDLQKALANQAIPMPQIDLDNAFAAAVAAVFKVPTLVPTFNYTKNDFTAYASAFFFEDVGVTAYYGAIDKISSRALVKAAAGILPVEAYHAGAIRKTLYDVGGQMDLYTYGNTKTSVSNAIAALRESISQAVAATPGGTDSGLTKTDQNGVTTQVIFPVADGAYAFERSAAQVIGIVTLNGANRKGGWFPNGLNGYIS